MIKYPITHSKVWTVRPFPMQVEHTNPRANTFVPWSNCTVFILVFWQYRASSITSSSFFPCLCSKEQSKGNLSARPEKMKDLQFTLGHPAFSPFLKFDCLKVQLARNLYLRYFLSNKSSSAIISRDVFTAQSNIYDGAFLRNYFCKKAPSSMLDLVLTRLCSVR